jgi:hypothetical protein
MLQRLETLPGWLLPTEQKTNRTEAVLQQNVTEKGQSLPQVSLSPIPDWQAFLLLPY